MSWLPALVAAAVTATLDWLVKPRAWTGLHAPPPRILVVEDDPNDADLLEAMLLKLGYACRVARDAESARALLGRNGYTLALVDLRLTHMDGWTLIPHIWREHASIHVVVTCSLVSDLTRIASPERGTFTVAVKPLDESRIKTLLERLRA